MRTRPPMRAGDPLAALLDQIPADRHTSQSARARQAGANLRRHLIKFDDHNRYL